MGEDPLRSLILTTHSMGEADALCSRIGIMVNGKLACIGTSQELKSHYGKGYSLVINLEDRSLMDSLHKRVKQIEPGVVITEVYGTQVCVISDAYIDSPKQCPFY